MNESAAVELAREAVTLAGAAGAQSAEASVSIARRFHVEARETAVARLEQSTGKSLFVRVFRDGRKATLSTSDFSPEGLRDAVSRAVAHADVVAPDGCAGLPDEVAGPDGALELVDVAVGARDRGKNIE